jgi:hypothetical protein
MLCMYMATLRGLTNRAIQDRWQHSGATVIKCVDEVDRDILKAISYSDTFKDRSVSTFGDPLEVEPSFILTLSRDISSYALE